MKYSTPEEVATAILTKQVQYQSILNHANRYIRDNPLSEEADVLKKGARLFTQWKKKIMEEAVEQWYNENSITK